MIKDPTLVSVLGAAVVALSGLVGAGLRAILTGKLVPRSQLDDAYRDRDKWEADSQVKGQIITEFGGRLEANTEALRLVERMVDALVARGPAR